MQTTFIDKYGVPTRKVNGIDMPYLFRRTLSDRTKDYESSFHITVWSGMGMKKQGAKYVPDGSGGVMMSVPMLDAINPEHLDLIEGYHGCSRCMKDIAPVKVDGVWKLVFKYSDNPVTDVKNGPVDLVKTVTVYFRDGEPMFRTNPETGANERNKYKAHIKFYLNINVVK